MDFADFHPLQVQGRALSGLGSIDLPGIDLQVAHPRPLPGRIEFDLSLFSNRAAHQRSGDNRSESPGAEATIDRQSKGEIRIAGGQGITQLGQGLPDGIQPLSTGSAEGNDGGFFQKGAAQVVLQLQLNQLDDLPIDQIALGNHHHPSRDGKEFADVEVFPGLRHDRLIGRHHQQHRIDSSNAGQHVLDEAFVAGNVHEAHSQPVAELQAGKTQIDGDPPLFFLFEAVRIHSRQDLDQGAFAMIDMTGRPHHNVLHGPLQDLVIFFT